MVTKKIVRFTPKNTNDTFWTRFGVCISFKPYKYPILYTIIRISEQYVIFFLIVVSANISVVTSRVAACWEDIVSCLSR